MSICRQTKPRDIFSLIVDDTGHRKSGTITEGVGRQYIGEVGKTDNGLVMVTTRSKKFTVRFCPIFTGKFFRRRMHKIQNSRKNPTLELIDKCLTRGYPPEVTLID